MAKCNTPRFGDEGFPLWKHEGSGRWCKKVRGRACYFGRIADDPKGVAAHQLWLQERDDLLAGRKPIRERQHHNSTVDVINAYLERCEGLVNSGELSALSFADYRFVGRLGQQQRAAGPVQLQPGLGREDRGRVDQEMAEEVAAEVRAEMESAFGEDLGAVGVHTDEDAARLSRALWAQAFTHGNDIYFNDGRIDPATSEGKHLLAHELTHTRQQQNKSG